MTSREASIKEIIISWMFEDLKNEDDLYNEYK